MPILTILTILQGTLMYEPALLTAVLLFAASLQDHSLRLRAGQATRVAVV